MLMTIERELTVQDKAVSRASLRQRLVKIVQIAETGANARMASTRRISSVKGAQCQKTYARHPAMA